MVYPFIAPAGKQTQYRNTFIPGWTWWFVELNPWRTPRLHSAQILMWMRFSFYRAQISAITQTLLIEASITGRKSHVVVSTSSCSLRAIKLANKTLKRISRGLTDINSPTYRHSGVIKKVLWSTTNSGVGLGVSLSESLETGGQSNNMLGLRTSTRSYCYRSKQLALGELWFTHYLFRGIFLSLVSKIQLHGVQGSG